MPNLDSNLPTFTVVIVGNAGVGKTQLVWRLLNAPDTTPLLETDFAKVGHVNSQYIPTLGMETHPILRMNNRGPCKYILQDTGGLHKGLDDGYYIGADGAIVLLDKNSNEPLEQQINAWSNKIHSKAPNVPILVYDGIVENDNILLNLLFNH